MAAPNGNFKKYGDRVAAMHNSGMGQMEIQAALGDALSYGQVGNIIKILRKRGVIEKPGFLLGMPRGFPYGSMSRMVKSLDEYQRRWLYNEAVKYGCESAEEIILEIVRDAHAESQC